MDGLIQWIGLIVLMDGWTDGETHVRTDGRWTDRHTLHSTDGQMDELTDERTVGLANGWMDEWIAGRIYVQIGG
jgi:hypothetical protein